MLNRTHKKFTSLYILYNIFHFVYIYHRFNIKLPDNSIDSVFQRAEPIIAAVYSHHI